MWHVFTSVTYLNMLFIGMLLCQGIFQRRSRSLSLSETPFHSLESIIMGVGTAFKAPEPEKEDNKNSIQRK